MHRISLKGTESVNLDNNILLKYSYMRTETCGSQAHLGITEDRVVVDGWRKNDCMYNNFLSIN